MAQRGNGLWLTLAFLSELAALGILAAWGWQAGSGAGRWLLAAGLPMAAAALAVASLLGAVVARPPQLSPAR